MSGVASALTSFDIMRFKLPTSDGVCGQGNALRKRRIRKAR